MCKGPLQHPVALAEQKETKAPRDPLFSNNWTTRWESPFSKWTEEDWKTRKFPTRGELKALIPEHCFERSVLAGFYFVVRDSLVPIVAFTVFRACGLSAQAPEAAWAFPLYAAAWFAYAIVMGGLCSGLWVIGHECGHGAFSDYPWLNDLVGWVLHSAFFVPYFSWQYTHAKHHRHTNDLIDGETHIAETLSDSLCKYQKAVYDAVGLRVFAIANFLAHFTFFYVLYFFGLASIGKHGADGKPIEPGTIVDHFRPNSRMFPAKWRLKVVLSDIGLMITAFVLFQFAQVYGYRSVFLWYCLPCLGMNHFWLVLVTWLHHTDVSVPHFGGDEWTWVKGAVVGTIDRPDPVMDLFAHNIGSTHLCHHLFHEMPHYHAKEATAHLRAYLEPRGMYNFDDTHMLKAAYMASKYCHYVESDQGVQFYKSFQDKKKDA